MQKAWLVGATMTRWSVRWNDVSLRTSATAGAILLVASLAGCAGTAETAVAAPAAGTTTTARGRDLGPTSSAGTPASSSPIAPANDGPLARTPEDTFAATSNNAFARTPEDAFAPTSDNAFAPTPDGAFAPTSNNAFAPTPSGALAPATAGAQAPAVAFDSARAWEHLRRQVALGPRPSGSPAIAATRRYIGEQLAAAGIMSREQAFIAMTPLGEVSMANVIATIPGRRPERIVLASHYDTKLYREFRFVGANDGASSTAAVLELGRVLAARQNELTIELLFLDGEEARMTEWRGTDNTYGSRHYVQTGLKDGSLKSLRALVLLDMIGDRDLLIKRDSNSTPWLVDAVWAAAARLGHGGTFSSQLTTIEDDHIPFLRAGVPAVDLIDLENPTWHTPQDDLEHVAARSLQIVGDVVLAAIPDIETRIVAQR